MAPPGEVRAAERALPLEYRSYRDYEDARAAFAALGASATYHFQTEGWRQLVAEQRHDVNWLVAARGGRPLAAVCVRREVRRHAGVGLRIACEAVLGEGLGGGGDGVADPEGCGSVVLEAVVGASGEWDAIVLRGVRVASPWLSFARGEGVAVELEERGGVGVIDTTCTAAEYRSEVPKKLRRSLQNALNRAARSGGLATTVARGAGFEAAYDQFLRLEDSGWKGRHGGSPARRDTDRSNLRGFVAAAAGGAVYLVAIGGQTVGAALCLTVGRSRIALKFAYDEARAELAPGNLVLAAVIADCCEDPGIDRLDCVRWWPWQTHWGMAREPTHRIVAFGSGPRALAARLDWRLERLRGRVR